MIKIIFKYLKGHSEVWEDLFFGFQAVPLVSVDAVTWSLKRAWCEKNGDLPPLGSGNLTVDER